MATEQEIQEQFDALVAEHGAAAISAAIKAHQPITADTTPPPTCPKGYYWNGTNCQLDVG